MSEETHRRETVMSEPQISLLLGDEFRCEQALAQRAAALEAIDPDCDRRVFF